MPRLELQAAVIASCLAKSIQEESLILFEDVKFFTDSAIVLAWIKSPSRGFKPFVSARVGEIQSNTNPGQWKHIPSEHNVADDVSRGIYAEEINGRWIKGPEFLYLPEDQWPITESKLPQEEDSERRQVIAALPQARKTERVIDPTEFSNWRRLIRVTARILRLAEKIRLRKHQQNGPKGSLTPQELNKAELFWLKREQVSLHERMKRGEFKSLSPFIDDKGVIRVGGRVDEAISEKQKIKTFCLINSKIFYSSSPFCLNFIIFHRFLSALLNLL